MAITWTPLNQGTAEPAPTDEHPALYRLTAPVGDFHQFDGSSPPGTTSPLVSFATTAYYGIYVEANTNRGRRQYKFVPTDNPPQFRFGYRYEVGLGEASRSGQFQSFLFGLTEIAAAVEPDVVIERISAMFVRFGGEMLIEVLGADEPPPPPPPPPPESELTPPAIVRFLNQTSFGATDATIAAVAAAGSYGAWIDQQLDLPVSRTEPYVVSAGNSSNRVARHEIWWRNVMEEPDQLRQRLAFAWSQIFVVSDRDYVLGNSQYGISNYYDMLAIHADGNFRTLLERVTLHPVMGVYLSMLRNERADPERNVRPDENFAREVLQLFSIGLYELTPDGQPVLDGSGRPVPTFDQETIEEFAKVFTGWEYDGTRWWGDTNINASWTQTPMVANEEYHDASEKRLLRGAVLPAGQPAYADLSAALDNIFNHPNVGPFISRLLIQRLVTSNPSPQYVARVANVFNNNGAGVRGDLRAVVRALLLDDEARNGPIAMPTTFGKFKEPVMRLTGLWRAFDARPGPDAAGVYRTYARPTYSIEDIVGQAVMRSPSVFNFFEPGHPLEPGSDLAAPEAQILSEINVAATNNMLLQSIYGDNNRSVQYRQNVTQIQIEPTVELASDIEALLDRLDLMLAAGQLPPAVRGAIAERISAHGDDDEGRYRRVVDATYCIVGSPFHLVQK